MNRETNDLDKILDRELERIRDASLDAETERAAADRVWARVRREIEALEPAAPAHAHLRDCEDFQALIPAFLRGGLVEARRLLLEDHLGECVPCRRALKQARARLARPRPVAAPVRETSWLARTGLRFAAAAVIVLAIVGLSVRTDVFTFETGGLIRIESVGGEAFRVTEEGSAPLRPGDSLSFEDGQRLRTGRGSNAMLRLEDGSRVEVGERAELAVLERGKPWNRRRDAVIDLSRGSVIVEASDQGSGHLYVDTPDARVSVTGTVFAVNSGVKGSRVSVIEGQVHVDHGEAKKDILSPGQQTTTSAALERVPVETEIAWSSQYEKHLALLREFSALGREIDATVKGPGLRYGTALLDRAPQGTAVYVALPNLASTLGEAYDLMQAKIAQNQLLSEWWNGSVVASGADAEIATAMERIRAYGRQLGPEIVVALNPAREGELDLLLLAELPDPAGFAELVRQDLARVAGAGDAAPVTLVEGELPSAPVGDDRLLLWVRNGLLAASPSRATLARFGATLDSGGASAFYGSPLHARLADLYANGVEWVIAVDVAALSGSSVPSSEGERAVQALGLADLQHVIAERREYAGRPENRVVLTFDQPRRGVASWLAEPAPIGSLGFVSPSAYFAAGFVVREPAQVVDEMIRALDTGEGGLGTALERFRDEHGIDVQRDIAQAIGGDFAFALDGPVLPKPSWKFVLEVYDPGRLQAAIARAIDEANEAMHANGRQGFALRESRSAGRTWYELESLDTGITAHWVYAEGYLVASASQPLLARALEFHRSGLSITSSPTVRALWPHDDQVHFSAVVFQNWGDVFGTLRSAMPPGVGIPHEGPEGAFLSELSGLASPNLTLAYGEPSRITIVNTSEGGLLGRGLASILSMQSMLDVREWLDHAVPDESAGPAPAGSARGSEPPVRETVSVR